MSEHARASPSRYEGEGPNERQTTDKTKSTPQQDETEAREFVWDALVDELWALVPRIDRDASCGKGELHAFSDQSKTWHKRLYCGDSAHRPDSDYRRNRFVRRAEEVFPDVLFEGRFTFSSAEEIDKRVKSFNNARRYLRSRGEKAECLCMRVADKVRGVPVGRKAGINVWASIPLSVSNSEAWKKLGGDEALAKFHLQASLPGVTHIWFSRGWVAETSTELSDKKEQWEIVKTGPVVGARIRELLRMTEGYGTLPDGIKPKVAHALAVHLKQHGRFWPQ